MAQIDLVLRGIDGIHGAGRVSVAAALMNRLQCSRRLGQAVIVMAGAGHSDPGRGRARGGAKINADGTGRMSCRH